MEAQSGESEIRAKFTDVPVGHEFRPTRGVIELEFTNSALPIFSELSFSVGVRNEQF